MGWVSPTGHETPTDWANPEYAYDEDTAFAATINISPETWSPFIVLTHDALTSDKLRFWADYREGSIETIDVDVYKDGGWVDVYQGSFLDREWDERTFTEGSVTKVRIRFYNSSPTLTRSGMVFEFDFWEVEAPPPSAPRVFGDGLVTIVAMKKAILGVVGKPLIRI